MADQVGSGTVVTVGGEAGALSAVMPGGHSHEAFHGRAVSWVSVTIILVGFLTGGLALVFGPVWPAFWTGVGITVVGGLLGLATGILNDWY